HRKLVAAAVVPFTTRRTAALTALTSRILGWAAEALLAARGAAGRREGESQRGQPHEPHHHASHRTRFERTHSHLSRLSLHGFGATLVGPAGPKVARNFPQAREVTALRPVQSASPVAGAVRLAGREREWLGRDGGRSQGRGRRVQRMRGAVGNVCWRRWSRTWGCGAAPCLRRTVQRFYRGHPRGRGARSTLGACVAVVVIEAGDAEGCVVEAVGLGARAGGGARGTARARVAAVTSLADGAARGGA